MLLNLLDQALTILSAPRKKFFNNAQARRILNNRQSIISPIPSIQNENHKEEMMDMSMNAKVQELPKRPRAHSAANKDTGFPEPLSADRNTTLPHPDADTSPNASIEAPDIALSKTRSRHSFLGRHHSHKISKDSGISMGGEVERDGEQRLKEGRNGEQQPEQGRNSEASASSGLSSEDEILRLKEIRDSQGYREGERKKGVLRKLKLHKV